MLTISRLKDGTYLITEAAGTKEGCDKLKALGYQVTSTANLQYAESQAPKAWAAYCQGKVREI